MNYLDYNGLIQYTTLIKNNFATKDEAGGGGIAYGTCTTAADTAAKTVTIDGFKLTAGALVDIVFNSAINTANTTLNISNTGAKEIWYSGAKINPGIVRPKCNLTMVYDGTKYIILHIGGLEQAAVSSDLYVDMGLPSGTLWATRNIDITLPNGFAESPYLYACSYFSWGNTDGHNPNGTTFDYTWGNSVTSSPYKDSQGSKISANINAPIDCARCKLGTPWRLPTERDCNELIVNTDWIDANGNVVTPGMSNYVINYNGVNGIRLRSKINNNELFLAACGRGLLATLGLLGSEVRYWSSTYSSDAQADHLYVKGTSYTTALGYARYAGLPIRPVM